MTVINGWENAQIHAPLRIIRTHITLLKNNEEEKHVIKMKRYLTMPSISGCSVIFQTNLN